ncbi:MAG: arylesterase [Alteromonadaceae bacterium]|nr:arylesterase [Alteromonadaceae bacterium]
MIKNALLALLISSNLLCIDLAFGSSGIEPTVNNTKTVSSILLLGDSLSASYGMKQNKGWVYLLNQQLAQQNSQYTITNASISGETTSGGLSRIPGILSKKKFDYLLIELGGNDGLRGFPPKLIKNNLLQIIKLAQAKNIPVSIMSIRIPPNYGPRYNKMFTDVFVEVAQETNIPLMPFFMESIAVMPKLMQADGIHPNVEAQSLIVDIMTKEFNQLMIDDSSGK